MYKLYIIHIKTHGSVSCGPRSRRVTPVSILTGRKKTAFLFTNPILSNKLCAQSLVNSICPPFVARRLLSFLRIIPRAPAIATSVVTAPPPLGPYLVIISFSSSLSNYYDAGGRVLPLCHYFIILTH